MKLRPILDRVAVKREEPKNITSGGVVLPESREDKKTNIGQVIAIGPGDFLKNGERQPMEVAVGETVLFCDFHTTQDHRIGDDIVILDQEDILAVVEEL